MKTEIEQKVLDVLSTILTTAPDGLHWDEYAARAIAEALQADLTEVVEPVGKVVSSGPANLPIFQWLSADHSFRVPIGSMLYAAPQEAAAPASVNADLLDELRNIANANPKNWDAPLNNSASFQEWAQSRARAAIAKVGGVA